MTLVLVLLAALAAANVAVYALFALDKRRAQAGGRRIPERTLILAAACTGTAGGWAAMVRRRHKTRKPSFVARMAAASLLDAAVLAGVLVLMGYWS